jgi:hypothetical protein
LRLERIDKEEAIAWSGVIERAKVFKVLSNILPCGE